METAGKERGGWFAGHFLTAENLLKSDQIEVKWAELTIGTNDKNATLNIKSNTLCILVSGTFLVDFGKHKVRFPGSSQPVQAKFLYIV
mmetsp:Transcript_20299/g.81842  ORF Transcript_20299/g.81842 Transcript_20299/m.81842 type:complete len:88 (-) Transcript_20299:2009-2272(-)